MKRVKGWEQRAAAYFRSVRTRAHEWGRHDCALFVAGALEAITGDDLAAQWRETYDNAFGAARVIASLGCADIADLPAAFGLTPVEPVMARRGDVVLVEGQDGPFLAIQWTPAPLGVDATGVVHVPREARILSAWSID